MIVDNIKVPTGLFIGGKWLNDRSHDIPVYNPATEELLTYVASADEQHVKLAIDSADNGLKIWKKTAPRERGEILRKAYQLMQDEKGLISKIITLEEGKTLAESKGEVNYASEFFRWFSEQAVQLNQMMSPSPNGDKAIMVCHHPVGITYLVTPWNFPAAMATRKIAPALAAGCSVILKPATETPLTALYIADLLQRAGVPDGVVSVLPAASARKVSQVMFADDRVAKLSFTGSTEVGKVLLHNSADRVVNTSMELGGNAPVIVLDDADLTNAVEQTLIAKIRNAGESCIAANRIYVARNLYQPFYKLLASKMENLVMGNGSDASVDIGPMVNKQTQSKVDYLVRDAIEKGAMLVTGGQVWKDKGYYCQPTVLCDLPNNCDILNEEIFGPVAVVIPFDSEKEVINLANDTPFGLAAYVMSENIPRAVNVASQIQAGVVGINKGVISDPAAPFGGMKQSGIGREGGYMGMGEFLEPQYIALDWPGSPNL
ncbi:Succinate-semialdehyde dehydrogenase (NAD(P)(+)) [Vibrio nigripulchritudo SOn1]|uniref:Succinate-semialdehyde dehydrogenase (NAD(P)(+)) n=1 Tax=Vibrio nigripulchritudo SOn1 TaxID=1238450 RepID=A0AAV2VTV8_9VIBR|nr:NAD-dependent succinate-semialdehyde dehydrogenase [Vibrio nigripulchritudo]CCO47877.1 Succinate-semialdehyde dehydrogenase (NAD(P)(+)) [Vibrio nigripulchritudo SOn1]